MRASFKLGSFRPCSLSALKSNLDPSLDLYRRCDPESVFPQADFPRQQKQQIAAIQREKVDARFRWACAFFPALLYGPGTPMAIPSPAPGRRPAWQVTRADLAKFHETWFKPNDATLIVVGDTTLAEIQPAIAQRSPTGSRARSPVKNIAAVDSAA